MAALVPVVVEAARTGDSISKLILDESGRALGLLTKALYGRPTALEVGLVGGIGRIWDLLNRLSLLLFKRSFRPFKYLSPAIPPLLEQLS